MKCGAKGFVNAAGQPCGQNLHGSEAACLWHSRGPEERRELAMRGSYASRLKAMPTLPEDTLPPMLDSPGGVYAELASTINDVRTGRLDHRLGAVVISGIATAIKLAELQLAAQVGDLERRFRLRRV